MQERPQAEQLLAALFGRKAIETGNNFFHAAALWSAMSVDRLNPANGPLRRAFKKDGWKVLLGPEPLKQADETDWLFHTNISKFFVAIMQASVTAIDTGNADQLRQLATALESVTPRKVSDPVGAYLVSCREGDSKNGFKQTRFPTANEVHDFSSQRYDDVPDIRTIYRRAIIMGIKLKEDARGRHGRRAKVHRAKKSPRDK